MVRSPNFSRGNKRNAYANHENGTLIGCSVRTAGKNSQAQLVHAEDSPTACLNIIGLSPLKDLTRFARKYSNPRWGFEERHCFSRLCPKSLNSLISPL